MKHDDLHQPGVVSGLAAVTSFLNWPGLVHNSDDHVSSGIQQYDTDPFQSAVPEGSQPEFTFIYALLDEKLVALAAGYQAICIFVNDVCDANVVEKLSELEVVRPRFISHYTGNRFSKPLFRGS